MIRTLTDPGDLLDLMGVPFSDEQMEAITAPMAPGVVIAGAGSGKTTVMVARVVWLVGSGQIESGRVLGLTFTRKAAGELSSRVRRALSLICEEDDPYPQISTYDSFASQLVGEFGAWVGVSPAPRILTGAEQSILADHVVRSMETPPGLLVDKAVSTLTSDLLALENRIQSHLLTEDEIAAYTRSFLDQLDQAPYYRGSPYRGVLDAKQTALERIDLLELCRAYREVKAAQGVAEFSDLMAVAQNMAARLDTVGATMRARYGLVIVDEYQDTSAAQAHLLSRLFGADGGVEDYPVTAVGDPLQAIYTWRGAAVDNIYSFHRSFPSARQRSYTLSINRRSGPQILAVANEVASRVRADAAATGLAAVELLPSSQAVQARVLVREFPTWEEEVDHLAESLAQAHQAGEVARWDDTAVLVRRNREIGPIVQACEAKGVPVAVQDLGGLLSVEAVSQVYAMLRLVTDETSNPEVVEVLSGPRFRLGTTDLSALGARARELNRVWAEAHPDAGVREARLMEAVVSPGPGRISAFARFAVAQLASQVRSAKAFHGAVMDHVRHIASVIGLDVEVYASQADARGHVRQFMAHVARFAADRPDADITSLVTYLMMEEESGAGLSQANPSVEDAVPIMTIHRAKGLEWDTVHLPCVVDKVFPDERVTDNPVTSPAALPTAIRSDASALPQIREVTNAGLKDYKEDLKEALSQSEDRLAYVALTRAKKKLVITSHRRSGDSARERERSRYVDVIAASGLADVQLCEAEANPVAMGGDQMERPWPSTDDPRWAQAARAVQRALGGVDTWPSGDLPQEVVDGITSWDDLIARLVHQARGVERVDVPVPTPLSTSQLMSLEKDPAAFAAGLARPRPRPETSQAGLGSRFHAWVQQYYTSSPIAQMSDSWEEETPAFSRLRQTFLASRFATARPCAVETDFMVTVDGHPVSGRIDAVFDADDNPDLVPEGKKVLIVDWKTGSRSSNPRQLSVYAQAWSERTGTPVELVGVGFFHVSTGVLQEAKADGAAPGTLAQVIYTTGQVGER
ncbi:MAG: ATP-dependent helicase [Propionibacteriaceae bacterium]|nr:ATP-dependent helicase [Propionibacteriaceae bacterium]